MRIQIGFSPESQQGELGEDARCLPRIAEEDKRGALPDRVQKTRSEGSSHYFRSFSVSECFMLKRTSTMLLSLFVILLPGPAALYCLFYWSALRMG